ncbi:MAG: hypothetical protein QXS68_04100 [Candidatus Methanomethylicaceae archaeon]
MQEVVSKIGPQPSSANERLEFLKAENPVREVIYKLDEFLAQAEVRMHYEVLMEPYDAGGLLGYKVCLILSEYSKEDHIVEFEEAYAEAVEEFTKKAKEPGATPGRWC